VRQDHGAHVRVNLFIQDESGDHNFDGEYLNALFAWEEMCRFQKNGGYYTEDNTVFVPWHRVNYARIEEIEEVDGDHD
jgi:hypothetical protein